MGKRMMQLYSCDKQHMDIFVKSIKEGFNIIKKYTDQKAFDIIEINPLDIGVFWFKTDTWDYILENIDFIKEQDFWSMFIYQMDATEEAYEKCLEGAKKLEESFGKLENGTITIKLNVREVDDFSKVISIIPKLKEIPSIERLILYFGERNFSDTVLLQHIPKVEFFAKKYNLQLSTCHAGEIKGLERYSTSSPCIDNNISNKLLNATSAVCKVNFENLSPMCGCHKALSLTGAEVFFNKETDTIKKSHLERYATKYGLTELLPTKKQKQAKTDKSSEEKKNVLKKKLMMEKQQRRKRNQKRKMYYQINLNNQNSLSNLRLRNQLKKD